MDARVAEKIFGWKYRGYGNGGGEWTLDGKTMAFGGHNGGSLPSYSTSIAAAWEVVEKMRFDWWHYSICSAVGSGACVEFFRFEHTKYEDAVAADGAPLAICRAALLAKLTLQENL
jgi:hypothetical protein